MQNIFFQFRCQEKYCFEFDSLKIFFGGELNTEYNDPDQKLSWVLNQGGLQLVKMRWGCYSYGVFLELSPVKNGGNHCLPTFFFPQIFLWRPYTFCPLATVLKKWNNSVIITITTYINGLKSMFWTFFSSFIPLSRPLQNCSV